MKKIPALFGSMVFNESVMKERLTKDAYRALCRTIKEGRALDPAVADVVASAMKDWAVEKGATHFTHWFQPMTGVTAEKHDAFLSPCGDGSGIMEFSGKELIKGEPDASSFPSGGLRATFEARGYTAWDPTSYAFIKDDTLCIPTAFCSYRGEILDKKTPLLRSMDVLSREAARVLKLFGKEVRRVTATVGPEQEYFLIDKADYAKRPDLILTGRTLFGAPAPKGQEMEDHYFGSIRPRVKAFMADLDEELWKLGIYAKTEHNEVAPSQHEMAPIFTTANLATDQNQLTMEVMKKVANRHGFVCLLHEKPFEGVNGSGKHNNWALSTDTGENLLDPGKTPMDNAQFLLFLTAVIRAVDEYQDLLRISVASAGNDHRLGGNEAPPAIVSVYVGDELSDVINALIRGIGHSDSAPGSMDIGVTALPPIPLDNSDRNRTSPFAFTGNKFEFRMPGSSFNIACPNIMLNCAVAESLGLYAGELEQAKDFDTALSALIRRELSAHSRILFNGNGYGADWPEEAARRGLMNLHNTPEALEHFDDAKNVALFTSQGIYTPEEIHSRQEIAQEEYAKTILIEARTSLDILHKQIIPACMAYSTQVAQGAAVKGSIGVSAEGEIALVRTITDKTSALMERTEALDKAVAAVPEAVKESARYCAETILPAMEAARAIADQLELLVDRAHWPFPTYRDLLFYV
ncbi:MAG: glutamine synthetase III [Pseudoflavonifractor capillosus]|uniref:glutamine synthetase III family protein n=1 Tax=Pseudoflavonifractor capillosus TaxID=106588 RepID=UPI0023FA1210|nr:glutamine synthetase III [Pseudoflavonifractor capillosus]MCI5927619.1 glutamine synthetase III [Pseudoflavonifractor capillosus]MDY4660992.1 glutamine synthetase III [Pseudoflavonifractor capillosus]